MAQPRRSIPIHLNELRCIARHIAGGVGGNGQFSACESSITKNALVAICVFKPDQIDAANKLDILHIEHALLFLKTNGGIKSIFCFVMMNVRIDRPQRTEQLH